MKKAYGLLIDYEYCSGCQSCEVACKEEHNLPVGKWGIRVLEDGPWEMEEGMFNWNKVPVPTDYCDLCESRTSSGREPSCVHHCLGNVMYYGTIDELAKRLADKPKQVLFVPQYKPLQAKGPFIPSSKERRGFAAIEVAENTAFSTSTQRSDSRTNLGLEKEDK